MAKRDKKAKRMAGNALRAAARLMESPLTGGLLFRVANEELGLSEIGEISISEKTPPYVARHLMAQATPAAQGKKNR
jgi:hypothetical protein